MSHIIPIIPIGNGAADSTLSGYNYAILASTNITLSQSINGQSQTLYLAGPSQSFQPVGSFGVSNIGNTSGNTGTVANQMILAGGNNVTLSQATNSNGITVTISGANQSNQNLSLYALGNTTQNSSTVLNANNLSFNGLGIITVGYSNGSIQISAVNDGTGAAIKGSGTYTQGTGTIEFAASNGITFGLSANGTMTASHNGITSQTNQNISMFALGNTTQNSSTLLNASNLSFNAIGSLTIGYSNGSIQFSAPNALTTAMVSDAGSRFVNTSAGLNLTNISATFNSNSISLSVNAQSVVPQNVSLFGLGNTTQNSSTALSLNALSFNAIGSLTVGYSNGSIQLSAPNALTTAMVSDAGSRFVNTSAGLNLTNISATLASNSISLSVGNYITTARASTDGIGLNTAQTNVTWTVNSNGISLNAGAYLTTAMASNRGTDFVQATAAFAGTNASGTIASNGISISVNAGGGGAAISADANSQSTGTVNFSNSNGVTFGLSNNGVMTASHNGITSQTNQNISLFALGNTTQNSSTLLNASNLSFNGLGMITVGYSNGSIQLSASQTKSPIGFSAGTASAVLNTVYFSDNLNNISFGLGTGASSSVITASYSQTNQNISLFALNQTTQNSSTVLNASNLSFAGRGIVTVGYSNGSIQISATEVAQSNQTIGLYALGNTTQNSSTTLDARTLSFNGLGIITAGYSNGSIQISATQSKQDISLYALGNTTQNSSTVLNASVLSFNAIGSLTAGFSNGSIQFSAPNALTTAMASNRGSDFVQATAAFAGTNASGTIASNGISISVAAGGGGNVSLFALGNTTQNSSTVLSVNALSFNAIGSLTVGYSNGSIQLSAPNALTTQSNQNISLFALGNTTQNSSTLLNASNLSFNGLGIASVGYSNGSIQISVPAGAPSPVNFSAGSTSGNLGSVVFADSNGISFGLNAATITASHNGITSQSNQNISLYALGNTTQNSSTLLNASNLSFNGLGIVTVGYSNGSIQISADQSTVAQNIRLFALGNTTQNSSTILSAGNISFNGLGGMTVGYSNGSIQLSAATTAGLISAINFSAGTTSNNTTQISFKNTNNISFGLDAGTITASYLEPLQSYFEYIPVYQGTTAFTMGGSSNYVQPFILPYNISASYIRIANSWAFGSTTGGTTANTSLTLNNSQTVYVNIYSKGVGANSKSLQFVAGGSVSLVFQVRCEIGAASNNQTVSFNYTYPSSEGAAQGNFAANYNVNSGSFNISTTGLTSFNGFRWLDIPFATSLSAGAYWMGIAQSTATATTGNILGFANVTARNTFVAVSEVSVNIALMGVSSNMSTAGWGNGLGYWSTNVLGSSSSSMSLAGISTVANQPRLPFQILREA